MKLDFGKRLGVSCGRTRTTERQYFTVQTLQRQASGKVDLISRGASERSVSCQYLCGQDREHLLGPAH
jgi:hypothetical protein